MKDILPPMANFGQIPDDTLRLVSYCPVCHYHYDPFEAKILEEGKGVHLIHVRCSRCNSAIVALIMTSSVGVSSVGLVTDLDGSEIVKFKDYHRISGDDVLAMYEFLGQEDLEKAIQN
jgi:hypothetical protein